MKNLTPHAIAIEVDGVRVTIPPSGVVARVATTEELVVADQPERAAECAALLGAPGALMVDDHERQLSIAVPVIRRRFGEVTGLPEGDEACLVSALVLEAVRLQQPWRRRVYAPDTGATASRDADGRVLAVTRLVAP